MDSMLQRHCARYIYVIPDGLRELMSDISREVLRSQPHDTYTFIADYLDALMITRENARVAARLVQSLTEMAITTATFLEETGMSREEIDTLVNGIQKTFKKSIEPDPTKERLSEEVEEANIVCDILHDIKINQDKAELAAAIIQQAYRRFKERKEKEKELLAGMVDWRVAARSAIHLYRRTGVTNEEANRAATLIKAAYKGYYTRRVMKKIATLTQEEALYEEFVDVSKRIQEEEGECDDDETDERHKAVTINFGEVKPHVDFDTSEADIARDQPEIPRHPSRVSSIVQHSLRYIFDTAFDRITKQSIISEEGPEAMSDGGDLASQARPVKSQEDLNFELKQEDSEAGTDKQYADLSESATVQEGAIGIDEVPGE